MCFVDGCGRMSKTVNDQVDDAEPTDGVCDY